jgi:hypothetical protein
MPLISVTGLMPIDFHDCRARFPKEVLVTDKEEADGQGPIRSVVCKVGGPPLHRLCSIWCFEALSLLAAGEKRTPVPLWNVERASRTRQTVPIS